MVPAKLCSDSSRVSAQGPKMSWTDGRLAGWSACWLPKGQVAYWKLQLLFSKKDNASQLWNLRFPSRWRRHWQPTPVLLPGKSHGRKSLVGCSPWGLEESDTTERLHFHFSLSCVGEGNGSPLQCSCLENPRDRGAWWAAMGSRLKRQNSSSSSIEKK